MYLDNLLVFFLLFQVEMFAVTAQETGRESEEMLDDLVEIQKNFFSQLNLHFKLNTVFISLYCLINAT